ncbi:MAG TPA: hypothetical protein ENJ56_07375 [Anaerolineae bacterium]|nr:hypothetical protein [Anaerolineae bacterium]
MESTRDTASTIGTLTHGVRIHHGYLGIVIIIATVLFLKTQKKVYALLLPAGIALLFSDLIHHFLILWPIVGTPQFDFFY